MKKSARPSAQAFGLWRRRHLFRPTSVRPGFGPIPRQPRASFLFLYFSKKKFTEIYFWFQILQFYTPTARQGGGRDLYVNKYNFFLRRGPWREPAAPLPGGRPPPAPSLGGRGPAARQRGGRPPPRTSGQIKFIFIYIEVPTAPLPGGRGI